MGTAKRVALVLIAAAAGFVAGCVSNGGTRQATSAALDRILAGNHRSEANRARDAYRHPKGTLLFFGIRPNMTVAEVWPGEGWYTEILAPLLREKGKFYAATFAADPASEYLTNVMKSYRAKLDSHPDLYDRVEMTTLSADGGGIAPPGTVDMVVTFRNLHNWMYRDWAPQALSTMYEALKPGGILGIVEHRGDDKVPQDPHAKNGYVNEAYAIRLIEAQGFRLEGKSEINANPKDTKDYEQGVWTLPPTYRLGDQDRAKYAAIGESDRFTLKFVKPVQKN